MRDYRWTVRLGDDGDCIEMLREVADASGLRYGELLEQALTDWYEHLPEEGTPVEALLPSGSGTPQQPFREGQRGDLASESERHWCESRLESVDRPRDVPSDKPC